MSPGTITLTGKLSLQETVDFFNCHSRFIIRPSIRVLFSSVSLCVLALVVWSVSKTGLTFPSIMIASLFFWFPFGSFIANRVAVRRDYRKQASSMTESTVVISDETVSLSAPQSEVRLNWELVSGLVNAKRGVLFLINKTSAWFWLPTRVFEGNDYRERILAMAAARGINVQSMP